MDWSFFCLSKSTVGWKNSTKHFDTTQHTQTEWTNPFPACSKNRKLEKLHETLPYNPAHTHRMDWAFFYFTTKQGWSVYSFHETVHTYVHHLELNRTAYTGETSDSERAVSHARRYHHNTLGHRLALEETSDRPGGGVHAGLPERADTNLNWTERATCLRHASPENGPLVLGQRSGTVPQQFPMACPSNTESLSGGTVAQAALWTKLNMENLNGTSSEEANWAQNAEYSSTGRRPVLVLLFIDPQYTYFFFFSSSFFGFSAHSRPFCVCVWLWNGFCFWKEKRSETRMFL